MTSRPPPIGPVDEAFGNGDIHSVVGQVLLDDMGVGHLQIQVHLRVALPVAGQKLRQKVDAQRRAGSDNELSTTESLEFGYALLGLFGQGNNLTGVACQKFPRGRQAYPFGQPVHQCGSQRTLQKSQLLGHGGLTDEQPFGRAADALFPSNGVEDCERVKIHDITKSYRKHTDYVLESYHKTR